MTAVYFWLAAIIVFSLIEAFTVGIVSIWFAFGSLCALIAAALHAPEYIQVIVFLGTSSIALFLTRPLIKKKILLNPTPTNFDMLIGETGIVEEDIDNLQGKGSVKIQGKIWSAKSANGEILPAQSTVTIIRIEGVKLICELSK
ncbi:MAG: NfeD family protein [Oscillospiraceae bacterium]|nr:NfeD family protein [Oscillospiraceae bacterium]MBQ4544777.1 NfeD family protein [Oscillospiraceae bacterium]MBQ6902806.1 NfeD family protein [Oscillospiraceae bacterium]